MGCAARLVLVFLLMFVPSGLCLKAREGQTREGQTPEGQTTSGSSVRPLPWKVRTMTMLVYPAMFAGEPVRVIDAVVRRAYGLRLLTVTDPHYRRYGKDLLHDTRDELLVVLPTAAHVPRGARINVVGTVRTLLGVLASGDPRWPADADKRVVKHFAEALVVVADSVETLGGTELAGAPDVP